MHEEMRMTQMQFTNTGAREIVPFLDTMFGGSKVPQRTFLRRRHGPSVGLFTVGIKTDPICNADAKDTMRECT